MSGWEFGLETLNANVTLTVPECSSIGMIELGLVALGLLRRKLDTSNWLSQSGPANRGRPPMETAFSFWSPVELSSNFAVRKWRNGTAAPSLLSSHRLSKVLIALHLGGFSAEPEKWLLFLY